MTRGNSEVSWVVDGTRPVVDAKPVTPIGRLVADVLRRHPDWTQAAIASRAGLERSVLNAYIHTPGRAMKQSTREALAKAMRIEQWELDEAAAEQAGYVIRRPVPDLDAHRLLSRVGDIPAQQRRLWFELARSIADVLASSDDRPSTGTGSDRPQISLDGSSGPHRLPAVTTERVQLTSEISGVLGRLGEVAAASPELREQLVTFSEDLFRRHENEQTGG